jgi:hypothetical protein
MKRLNAALLSLLALSASAFATTYQHTFTGGVTSGTILNSDSHMNTPYIGVAAKTSTGVVLDRKAGQFSWTIDGSYNVSLTFQNPFTGTVELSGPLSDTTASTDFKLTSSGALSAVLCSACDTAYAMRDYQSFNWQMSGSSKFVIYSYTGITTYTVNVYLTPTGIVWVIPTGMNASCSGQSCTVSVNTPSNGIQMGYGTLSSTDNAGFISITDTRPSQFQ